MKVVPQVFQLEEDLMSVHKAAGLPAQLSAHRSIPENLRLSFSDSFETPVHAVFSGGVCI